MTDRRTNVTAGWIALLIVAATQASMEQRHYEQRAMQMEFRTVIESQKENAGRVAALSDWGREARHAADQVENIGAHFVAALGIAGVAITVSGAMWWALFLGSVLVAGRAGYFAATALGAI